MKDEPIPEVPVENLGPAMLALNERQRRFVIGWIGNGGKNATRVVRASGYNLKEGADRVQAHWLLHNPKIIAAIQEEGERRFQAVAVQAMLGLEKLTQHKDAKVKQAAISDFLDRTVGRKTTQTITVTHEDNRSTAQLLEEMRRLAAPRTALPVIEGECEVVRE